MKTIDKENIQRERQQSPVCDCGNPNAAWRGDRHGLRSFRCEQCEAIYSALEWLKSDHVQQNKFRLGALGAQDIDYAVTALQRAQP
jgi:hypothetical protein